MKTLLELYRSFKNPALMIFNALESGLPILIFPIVSANKYSFVGNVYMCQDRATVANPLTIPEKPNVIRHNIYLAKQLLNM